jgi:hypothetical protein
LPIEDRLDQKHATGSLQKLMPRTPFVATMLSGIDRNHLSVQRTKRIFLADQLASLPARSRQAAQPRKPSPHATVGHRGASFRQGMVLPVVIHQEPVLVSHGFPIGLVGSQKVLRFVEHGLADELFVAQGERGDSP